MYYNDYNRFDEDENPIEVPYQVSPPTPPLKKKNGRAKLIALCLVCALIGGMAGGAGVGLATGALSTGKTTIYEGSRDQVTVATASVDTRTALTATQIYATYVGSTVGITVDIVTTNVFGQTVKGAAAGSGFVITADGYILTNYHVIESANSITVNFVDGSSYPATLIGGEEDNDIAVLKINAAGLTPVIIGDSGKMLVGDQVFAIGNPLGELTYSLTGGYVSALNRSITMSDGTAMNMIQTDTAINSGNSGGPLFNIYGEVIGITSAKYSSDSTSGTASIEGLGFAIPINVVVDLAKDIMKNGYVTGKPFLGISVKTVDSTSQQYGLPAGAYVSLVTPSLCADKAGLKEGDIITAIDDTKVTSSAELIAAKNKYKAGDTVKLTVYRNGQTLTLEVTMDEDNTANQKAQNDYVSQQEQQQQQQQQEQQSNNGFSYNWPFNFFR
jgi:serine protease Do